MRGQSECLGHLQAAGIAWDDACALRRISMTLHRWHELECGGTEGPESRYSLELAHGRRIKGGFEYDEDNGATYLLYHWHDGKTTNRRIPDREKGARKRLGALLARYPGFSAYVQGDPRGCALYVLRPSDVKAGEDVSSVYTRGIAVYR